MPATRQPNILLLMSDQQQAATADPRSPCQTPALDRLCREGVRFTRAYTPNAICSPARATLYTGLWPHTHGMVDCTHTVEDYRADYRADLPVWPQRLHEAGYRTAHFGKWHVERTNRLEDFGFDEYGEGGPGFAAHRRALGLPPQRDRFASRFRVPHQGYRDLDLYGVVDEPAEASAEYYLYDRGADFIRRAAADPQRPWCCVISTQGPHDPYIVPAECARRYDPRDIAPPASFEDDLADRPAIYRRVRDVWRGLEWRHFAEATACYYAFCSLIDDQVGRVLRLLDELGQTDNTLVLYTTDHGDLMGAHRLLLKGVPAFEEVYRIPFLARWPAAAPGGREVDAFTGLVDVAPTLLEAAGLPPLPRQHGCSFAPLLRGEAPPAWRDGMFAEFHGQRFFYTQRLVWDRRYKYVFNGFDYDELYDLQEDPHEQVNRAADPACRGIAEDLARRMWRTIRDTGDHNMHDARYGMFRFAPWGPDGE